MLLHKRFLKMFNFSLGRPQDVHLPESILNEFVVCIQLTASTIASRV